MEQIRNQLENNVKKLENELPLSDKISIIKDSKKIFEDGKQNLETFKEEIETYIPKIIEIDNLQNLMNDVEKNIDNFKDLNLEKSVESFKDLMNKLETIEKYVNEENGKTITLE